MTWILLVILVAALVAIGFVVIDRRRSAELQQQFGPEYERAVEQHGRRAAESDLRRRLARRRSADVRELSGEARERLVARWRVVQTGFVDDPQASVAEAAGLVEQAMAERGYLGGAADGRRHGLVADGDTVRGVDADRAVDGDRRFDDDGVGDDDGDGARDRYELVAVDHPVLVERFRSAPPVGTAGGDLDDAPAMSADELRSLFLQHQELFEALVDPRTSRTSHLEEARS